ncbi:MAG: hypothetical protein H8E63_07615 [Proteobacteria bacterium]|nr:hypothetical protein [Pseudomonadota bacterium]
MVKKPSYISLLNDLATGERERGEQFKHWAAATPDKKLKPTLDMVSIRETEHSWALEKRLWELGYSVEPAKPDKALIKLMKSNASDEEKFVAIGFGGYGEQQLDEANAQMLQWLFGDKNMDLKTSEFMGRFFWEERDTATRLLEAYKAQQRRGSPPLRKTRKKR